MSHQVPSLLCTLARILSTRLSHKTLTILSESDWSRSATDRVNPPQCMGVFTTPVLTQVASLGATCANHQNLCS